MVSNDSGYEPDLVVNNVSPLSKDEFFVQAYIMTTFKKADENYQKFKESFQGYVSTMLHSTAIDALQHINISVDLFNATSTPEKETMVWFKMKSSDLNVTDEDFALKSEYSIFDLIFDYFAIEDFEVYENNDEIETTVKAITVDIEEQQIRDDYESQNSRETLKSICKCMLHLNIFNYQLFI